jgi:hypothetical protein
MIDISTKKGSLPETSAIPQLLRELKVHFVASTSF